MTDVYYFWDSVSDSVMQELDSAFQPTVTYTREPSMYGPLVSEQRGNQFRQYHFDALGSTRALTDESGDVTDTFAYDAWGKTISHIGTTRTSYFWTGRWGYRHCVGIGGCYIRMRWYLPTLGRWRSVDPIAAYTVAAAYLYSTNTPVMRLDPSGLVDITFTPTPTESCTYSVDYLYTAKGITKTMHRRFKCVCEPCREQLSCRYSMSCSIDVALRIYLDPGFDEKPLTLRKLLDLGRSRNTLAGIYGHEQRHVENNRSIVNKIAAEMRKCEASCGPTSPYRSKSQCRQRAKQCEEYAIAMWLSLSAQEANHSLYDVPEPRIDYLPLGSMPWPPPNLV